MARPALQFRPNSSSGVPLLALGALALVTGLKEHNLLCMGLGAVLLALPLGTLWMLRTVASSLRVWRRFPSTVFEDDVFTAQVSLQNPSRLPVFQAVVSELCGPAGSEQKDVIFSDRIAPGEEARLDYTVECKALRGVSHVGPLGLTVTDPFGWFQVRRVFPERWPVKVYPRFTPAATADQAGCEERGALDEITHKLSGETSEFFAVREYQRGDPIRRIHWRLTAHRGVPIVREFSRSSAGSLSIFLDLYRNGLVGVGRGSSLERAARIAAGLTARAVRRGVPVELAACGRVDVCVPRATGPAQLQAMLDALIDLRPDGEAPLHRWLPEATRNVLPGSTAVIMVSPYEMRPGALEPTVRALASRQAKPVLILFDTRSFRSLYGVSDDCLSAAEYKLHMLQVGALCHIVSANAGVPASSHTAERLA